MGRNWLCVDRACVSVPGREIMVYVDIQPEGAVNDYIKGAKTTLDLSELWEFTMNVVFALSQELADQAEWYESEDMKKIALDVSNMVGKLKDLKERFEAKKKDIQKKRGSPWD